jgi:hypothetical protein
MEVRRGVALCFAGEVMMERDEERRVAGLCNGATAFRGQTKFWQTDGLSKRPLLRTVEVDLSIERET